MAVIPIQHDHMNTFLLALSLWGFAYQQGNEREDKFWDAIAEYHLERDLLHAKQAQREEESQLSAITAIVVHDPVGELGVSEHTVITGLFVAVADVRENKSPKAKLPALLAIKMPCGAEYRIEWGDKMPTNSVPCTCGNTNHWFIQLEENLTVQ